MPRFSNASKKRLKDVHPLLRDILQFAVRFVDFTVLVGFRDKEQQDKEFAEGDSKVRWPNSKHNKVPAEAVDIAPYPIDWSNRERFYYVSGFVMGAGSAMLYFLGLDKKLKLRFGGDWDQDGEIADNKFDDIGHIELVRNQD